jgi:uncharacterized DUF497 family protein
MKVQWNPDKERRLAAERGISLAEVADLIVAGRYIGVFENPSRPSQAIFLVSYHGYTHAVPFVIDKDQIIILKTAYPSRKFHRIFGRRHEDKA